jgi:CDP-diacylglycerol---glycerol-3-phosphate 3-phosphatidyltransferase
MTEAVMDAAAKPRPHPLNLANLLTVFRIASVPLIVWLMVADWGVPGLGGDYGKVLALVLTFVSGITDYFDGMIARMQGIETKLGKFLDPVADKLLVCSLFTILVATHHVAPWVLIVMFWREFLVLGLRMHLASDGTVLGASNWAKWKTIFQVAALVAWLIVWSLQVLAISGDLRVYWVSMLYYVQIAESLVLVSLILSVMSGLEYFQLHWDVLKRG